MLLIEIEYVDDVVGYEIYICIWKNYCCLGF